jgi:HlyD family secretion protein
VDAYPGERFDGVIRQIRNAAQTVQNVVTYDAVIDVSNPELKLKPGMTSNVTIITAQKDHVLAVPNAALRFRPPVPEGAPAQPATAEDGTRALYVLRAQGDRPPRPQPVRVRTGMTDGAFTEVVEGDVHAGDAIVTGMTSTGTTSTTPTPVGGGAGPGGRPGGGGMRRGPF